MRLNAEEMNFIVIFNTESRDKAMQEIVSRIPYIEDKDLEEVAEHVILKLDRMTDEEYAAIDFDAWREA